MATFPTSIPSYLGFTASHTLAADLHASQHNSEQGDITAIATKVGIGASTPTVSKLLRGTGTGTSSWAQADLTTDVTGVLPVANGGTGQSTVAAFISNAYPVGSIYTETTGINPGTTFGFGTWTVFGAGRVLIGNGTSDQTFTAGNTGGESNHTLTTAEMPAHTHTYTGPGDTGGSEGATPSSVFKVPSTGNTGSSGSGNAHNNLQPYVVVYFWQRTA